MLFLFPSDYFNHKQAEADYATEYEAVCKIPEFKTLLWNHDGYIAGEPIKLYPSNFYTGGCVYRGWMLNPSQYSKLYTTLNDSGINLINTPAEYEACHLFPNVRDALGEHTPKSLCFEEAIDWDLVNRTFKRFMVKDYVKSVKGHDFPIFFETPVKADEMARYMARFRELRGDLFTGGIVLKDYVDLKRYGDHTNEYRAFYFKGKLLSLSRNSNQSASCPSTPLWFVNKFANLPSNYYTVDFAETSTGWIVVETGDGGVSGLSPGQWKYYDDFRQMLS